MKKFLFLMLVLCLSAVSGCAVKSNLNSTVPEKSEVLYIPAEKTNISVDLVSVSDSELPPCAEVEASYFFQVAINTDMDYNMVIKKMGQPIKKDTPSWAKDICILEYPNFQAGFFVDTGQLYTINLSTFTGLKVGTPTTKEDIARCFKKGIAYRQGVQNQSYLDGNKYFTMTYKEKNGGQYIHFVVVDGLLKFIQINESRTFITYV